MKCSPSRAARSRKYDPGGGEGEDMNHPEPEPGAAGLALLAVVILAGLWAAVCVGAAYL